MVKIKINPQKYGDHKTIQNLNKEIEMIPQG
jgi:hypothetical protein